MPRGHVWLEGDNKAASHDSRHYGPVPVTWFQFRAHEYGHMGVSLNGGTPKTPQNDRF